MAEPRGFACLQADALQSCTRILLRTFLTAFSLADSIARVPPRTRVTYKTQVNGLLLVKLLVNSRLLSFGGSKKLYVNFQLCVWGGQCP